jgi:hypothetical protein
MPDVDLREALHDLTDEVALVDLLPRVEKRLVTRRRRRAISAGVATVFVIGGVVAALAATRAGSADPLPLGSPKPSASTPSNVLGSESVLPSWLPPGVTLAGQDYLMPSPAESNPDWKPAPHSWYRIDGPANANTIPPGGPSAENATTVHPDTTIDITFIPSVSGMPPVPGQPRYVIRRTITIAGNPALVSIPKNGYGAFRIDWVDPAGYHVVMCDRLNTPDGRSGVPMNDLVHMARSLYPTADTTSENSSPAPEPNFTVGYLPPGFHLVVDPDNAGPPPAEISSQAFLDDGPAGVQRSLSVEVLRGDAFSDVDTYAAENGHLRLTSIGGRPGAVGWNVPSHDGLHLAYRVVSDGVAVQVVERDGRAVPLSDAELSRVAASVRIS